MQITTLPVYSKLAEPADVQATFGRELPVQLSKHQLETYRALIDPNIGVGDYVCPHSSRSIVWSIAGTGARIPWPSANQLCCSKPKRWRCARRTPIPRRSFYKGVAIKNNSQNPEKERTFFIISVLD
jgi:hypothetical protein